MTDAPTLGESGQVLYISGSAALAYGRARGLQPEEARKQLTLLLLDATGPRESSTGAETWRARSRTMGVDVSATVVREPRLAVVTAVNVRGYR